MGIVLILVSVSRKYLWIAPSGVLQWRGGPEGASTESWEPVYGRSLPCLNDDCGDSVVVETSVCNVSGDWLKTAATEIAEGGGRTMCDTDRALLEFIFIYFSLYTKGGRNSTFKVTSFDKI